MNFSNCHTKRLIVVAILIFFSQIFAQSPDFSVTINVTGGVGSYDLTIGFSPDATDGYDDGVDAYAPPQPPSPAFDAALFWENDRYYTQIVNGDSLDLIEHVWNIQLQYPEDNLITLSWDNGCLSVLGTFTLQDASGGNLVSVDMTTVDVLILDNPGINILELKVTPNEYFPDVPPQGFDFTPNPASGTFIGTVTINGQNAEECDWIAAFDEDGNCAGSAILVLNDDLAWINIPIYGDDSTTPDADEGMNPGENFVLKLWDASSGLILEYPISFDCWSNQNGAPMPNCGGIDEIYNFFYSSFFSVSLLVEPEGSGIVSGSGNYFENAIVTVTATANDGYTFVNWTEAGIEVSVEAFYNFTITEDRNLVANFELTGYTGPKDDLTLIKVVPNPFLRRSQLDEGEFPRLIRFTNLPVQCTITIFTLTGEKVITLDHHNETDYFWNLKTINNQEIAPGLYLFAVETKTDKHIGKFAVVH